MRIIERNTDERKQDTIDLYNQIKPLLDQGLPITTAVKQYLGIQYNSFSNRTWYKELRDYAVSQGYKMQR
jgi:type II secretory pathway component PulF